MKCDILKQANLEGAPLLMIRYSKKINWGKISFRPPLAVYKKFHLKKVLQNLVMRVAKTSKSLSTDCNIKFTLSIVINVMKRHLS